MKRIIALLLLTGLAACSTDGGLKSSRAYKGHESDADMNRFVTVYPRRNVDMAILP